MMILTAEQKELMIKAEAEGRLFKQHDGWKVKSKVFKQVMTFRTKTRAVEFIESDEKVFDQEERMKKSVAELHGWAKSVEGSIVSQNITNVPNSIFTEARELLNEK